MTAPAQADAAAHYQAAQAGLATVVARDVPAAFGMLAPADLGGTMADFKAAIAALVHRYGPASASLAASRYLAERRAAGITEKFRPRAAPLPPLPEIGANMDWATRSMWTPDTVDLQAVQTQVTGAVEKLVLDVGRKTTIGAAAADATALGWYRVTEPGACSFCLLLATRGAVYKSKRSAGPNRRSRRNRVRPDEVFAGAGEFKVHDHCRCSVEPIFHAYEPSAEMRHWDRVYAESTRGVSGKDKAKAFRRAVEAEQGH